MPPKMVHAGETAEKMNVEKTVMLNVLNWEKNKKKDWNNKKVNKNALTPDIIHKM